MSDAATPTSTKKAGWTDTEKVGLLFQIIEKMGKIPWNELELPEGRTLKAVQVMIDKEKTKVRKAREGPGSNGDEAATPSKKGTPAKGKKRGAGLDEEETPTAKKAKLPRKKKIVAGEDEIGSDEEQVKVEDE